MSTPISLQSVPNELMSDILHHLSSHDLAQLAATCKQFSTIVEPLLWTEIEFHVAGYHESKAELNDPPPFVPPSQRRYLENRDCGVRASEKAETFFNLLQYYQVQDEYRLKQLAARVRSLCTVVVPAWRPHKYLDETRASQCPQVWTLFPYFANLEALELHGDSVYSAEYEEEESYTLSPPIFNLRFLKLSAYIPRTVASWAITSGSKLERLELGMLDRPISSSLCRSPRFKPLPSKEVLESGDQESDSDSLYGEAVIPRPLGRFLHGHDQTGFSLPRLRHLYLCQPSEGSWYSATPEYSWSSRAEKECLEDWRNILTVSGKTLEVLVLEQRAGADYLESDGAGEEDFIMDTVGESSSQKLVNVLETLVKDGKLPALNHVYLNGIAVRETSEGKPAENGPSDYFMLLLQSLNIKCEARLGRWCFFDKYPGVTYWAEWSGESEDEEDEDDEEGHNGGIAMKWDTVLSRV